MNVQETLQTALARRLSKMVTAALAGDVGPRERERVEKLQSLVVEKNFRAASKQLAKLSAAMPRVFPPWTIEAAKRASND